MTKRRRALAATASDYVGGMNSPYKSATGRWLVGRARGALGARIAAAAVVAASLGACAAGAVEVGQAAQPGVPATEAETATILEPVDPTTGAALLADGAVLIDVRTPEEFDEAHIDGALLIDISAPDFLDRLGELDPDTAYVVYCRSGNRSRAAVEVMAQLGFTEVYDMGGIQQWIAEGRPVVEA